MLGQIFLTSCLVMMTSCWRIEVNEKNVAKQLSSNVTLDCRNEDDDDNNSGKFKQITKLIILKRNLYNHWVSLAKVERDPPLVETSLQNVILTGSASTLSNSFLKLQFPFATDDAIGQFVCEVEGYFIGNDKVKHFVKTKTEPVVITERDATSQDILKVILQLKQETKKVNDHLFALLQNIINRYDKDFEKMSNLHNKDFENVKEDLKSIAQTNPALTWPSGRYALLRAGTECPYSSTFDWKFSSYPFTTKPGPTNNDRTSHPSHLSPDTLKYNTTTGFHYVNLIMCSKGKEVYGPAWPKGSYCTLYDFGCPDEFTDGGMAIGRYDDGSYGDVTVNYQHGVSKTVNYLWYCCRNDGDPNTPIELPFKDPFYLYRFGGTCQLVNGMHYFPEWIQLDSNPNYTKIHPSYPRVPDASVNPHRVELCYYKLREGIL